MVLLVLVPALLLPGISQDISQGLTLIALIAGVVVVVEYTARHPGLIEFRDAKPYNRARFALFFAIVLALTMMQRAVSLHDGQHVPQIAMWLGAALDFNFSPVRMLRAALPAGLTQEHGANVQAAASVAFVLAQLGLLGFLAAVYMRYWPNRSSVLNVWVNLPNFDPTKGIDVVHRLEREGQVNILVGIILPFSLPVLLHISSLLVQPLTLETPLSLVWGVALWAFVPVSLVMRGVAMYRVAQLIRAQRRRIADAEASVPLPVRSAYS
ncbi:hypothetical protein [Roseinatronobacter alkalisoli]|uniref:Uncharacterized protein n=1 Tax=Roseinatronobacter alkalisoli TaxID=3028235 RepID=A0ABT5T9X8_9RHOB|nr:hypothetical protein [Roseinatronobacter sp. HJB301]MDD7971924.1 hypothetical protein [Roseinatronobacter sp. HJB301]